MLKSSLRAEADFLVSAFTISKIRKVGGVYNMYILMLQAFVVFFLLNIFDMHVAGSQVDEQENPFVFCVSNDTALC